MIRVLVIIAVTGFLASVVSLSAAVAIGGPDLLERAHWEPGDHWNFQFPRHGWGARHRHWNDDEDGGPRTSREIAWTGGEAVEFDLPANVTYTQAPGPAKLVVTGPRDAVADVEVDDGTVRFDGHGDRDADLTIVMTAPSITRFQLSGSGKLAIAGYKQDKLTVDLPGDAEFSAKGETKAVQLSISGSGSADLSDLKASAADVTIEGSGSAKLAPRDVAKIDISGSGDVTLLSHPPHLESHVSGSGEVVQQDGASVAPSSPGPPAKKGRGA